MKIKQISVFLENVSGRLAEVTGILAEENINLRAMTIADTADFGILRLIVDDPERTEEVLENHKFTAKITDVLAIEVPDRPGGLAGVMDVFRKNNVNIEYLYVTLEKNKDNAVVIFKVGDLDKGLKIAEENGLKADVTF